MQKHTLFIADLHLSADTPETTKLFFNFLENNVPQADALFILGDLFKLWVGDDDNSTYNQLIKNALKKASVKTPIYFLPGNRDFLLGKKFATECGCTLIPDVYKLNLYDMPTLLTHGDRLYTKDIIHILFRKLTSIKILVKLFLLLPFKFRSTLAYEVQRFSINHKKRRQHRYIKFPQKNIEKLLKKFSAMQIIYGHIHVQSITNFKYDDKDIRCIILGDWNETGNVLKYYDDNTCELLIIK